MRLRVEIGEDANWGKIKPLWYVYIVTICSVDVL